MYKDFLCCAVIAAGGSGSRFGEKNIPKQFLPLKGRPVIAWAAGLIQNCSYVDFAVMVMRRDLLARWDEITALYGFDKFTSISGGDCRQASVLSGLRRAEEVADGRKALCIVHDGARPLSSPGFLEETIKAAFDHGAALCAVPSRDTIKEARPPDMAFVSKTPNRTAMYAAQTPQVFHLDLLIKAHETAIADGFTGYDDACLVERLGGDVRIIPGSNTNIKITFPEDIALAEALMKFYNQA